MISIAGIIFKVLGIVMKEQMRYVYKIFLIIMVIMLQACGSSGDKTVFSISADVKEISFSNEIFKESTDSIAIEVQFEGEGLLVGFSPDVEPTPWLTYRSENVTDTSATIYIDVINAQFLPADTYTTKIRIATSNEDASKFASHDIDVSLLVWNLALDTQQIDFNGTFGDSTIAAQTINLTSENNAWTASADVSWLSLDVTSGTGDASIVVTPDISDFSASGLQEANLVFTEISSGDSKKIPVNLALDNVYLFADRTAVALTSTATISALSTSVNVSNNGMLLVDWQASTTADWLTVTKDNTNQLHISADPNSAPMNEISSAQVIIAATQSEAVITDTINVSFYNSELVVENKVLEGVEINDNNLLASPLLPNFYAAVGNQLITYHQYTGEVISNLAVSPENTLLEQLIIHPNGDYLLAKATETVVNEDQTTTEVVHRYRINLIDNTLTELLDATILYEPTGIVRLSGRYFVVTQTLEFADENLQVLFWDNANAYFASKSMMATQANSLFALDNSNVSFKRYIPQINDFGDNRIIMTQTHEYHPESLAQGQLIRDFIVTNDESGIYAISETSEWISFDGENFVDHGLLETNENIVTLFLAKNIDNEPNYLRIDTTNTLGFYLDIYNTQQTLMTTVYTNGSQPDNIQLTSDAQRLLLNVDETNNPEVNSQVELVTLVQ